MNLVLPDAAFPISAFRCLIPRHPESKHNSRRIHRSRGGKIFVRLSEEAEQFMKIAVAVLRAEASGQSFGFDRKLRMICRVAYPDYRHDEDVQLVKDALQAAGVVANDRQIREVRTDVIDEHGSFVEVELLDVGPLPWTPSLKPREKW